MDLLRSTSLEMDMRPIVSCFLLIMTSWIVTPSGRMLIMSRIYGGANISIETHPWQVSFHDVRYGHFCGGSIITKRWIITAAHCVYRLPIHRISVISGTTDLQEPGNKSSIVRVVRHRKFNIRSMANDIALVKLKAPVPFNEKTGPVTIPTEVAAPRMRARRPRSRRRRRRRVNRRRRRTQTQTQTRPADVLGAGQAVEVTGWGRISDGSTPTALQGVTLGYVSTANCMRRYGRHHILNGMICAASPQKDSCQGDSGGPLVVGNILYGIVSWGTGCANPRFPGVYTDVHYYREWINTTLVTYGSRI